jgi:hypothetical protein
MKAKMISLMLLSISLSISIITYAGDNITNEFAIQSKIRSHIIEKPEKHVWIRKNYDEDGKLVEIIPMRWFSVVEGGNRLKRHGNYLLFDKDGSCLKSEWYFKDKAVSKDEFDAMLKTESLDEPKKRAETSEDKKAKDFISKLSLAWQKGNDAECKSIITEEKEKSPDWIPVIIAEYGYLTFIEHNDKKATEVLGRAKELIKEQEEVSKGQKSQLETGMWNFFKATYNSYYEQSAKGTKGCFKILNKEIEFGKAREEYVLFPPSDLMAAYLLASGVRIDMSPLIKGLEEKFGLDTKRTHQGRVSTNTSQTAVGVPQIPGSGKTNDLGNAER